MRIEFLEIITPRYSVSSTSNSHFSTLRKSLFSQVLGEDQDIVKVDGHLALSDEVAEDVVHHPLECGRRVCEPEEHNREFKEASVGAKGGLLLISFFDPDIVVSPMNVELREVLGSTKLIDELRDEGKRVSVLDCHLIELSVVLHLMLHRMTFLYANQQLSGLHTECQLAYTP